MPGHVFVTGGDTGHWVGASACAFVALLSCGHVSMADPPAAAPVEDTAAPSAADEQPGDGGLTGACVRRPVRFPMPDPDPRVAHVTHAWPHWQWPSVYLQSRPAFLVRIDQVVDPQTVLDAIRITGWNMSSWQKIEWAIRACVIEQDQNGAAYTTIVFQPVEPLQAGVGGGYDWLLSLAATPAFKPLHQGLTTTNQQAGGVFGVGGQEPQVGSIFQGATIAGALGVGRHPDEIWSALRNAEESFIMIREWSDLTVPSSADRALKERMQELRDLRGNTTPSWRLVQ